VRRFSSEDKAAAVDVDGLNIPTYWVRPPRVVSTQAGMHRFVWDLRYPPPESLETQFPISAIYHDTPHYPLGPAVLPGHYNVRLMADGKSYTQPLIVKMDPRVKSSSEDLRRQFDLERKIVMAAHRDYQALQHVRGLRQQLKALQGRVADGSLLEAVASLDTKLNELEGDGEGRIFFTTPQGRSLAHLNAGLTTLLETVDGADAGPTTSQEATRGDLQIALDQQLLNWEKVKKTDVPDLNSKLERSGLPPLNAESAAIIDPEWHSAEKAAGED